MKVLWLVAVSLAQLKMHKTPLLITVSLSLSCSTMDIVIREGDISLSQIGIYASVSFLVVTAVGAVLYITCSRRYRLNWFEQNLLESASEKDEEQQR